MSRASILIVLLLASLPAAAKENSTTPQATTPVPQRDDWAQDWWPGRHQEKLAERDRLVASGEPLGVVFVGDSITHSWENAGKQLWAERFAKHGAFNIGFSGDRTEQVLWRLGLGDAGEANNQLAGLSPKLFVMMIGTNNTGHRQDPPEQTAAGVTAIVDRLHELSPESKVLLLGVFPRGATTDDPLRVINDAINERIAELGERSHVEFLNINEVFLTEEGVLPEKIMPDLLHPTAEGYRLWADAIGPHVERLLAE
ncbi:GDSL-like Lipase/Acylhydrolase [Planctomycetes bacterium MalM25]|nr:GDSL-like Lipase/Acylhydrolase [Planctomycetes bacterium MalM25]